MKGRLFGEFFYRLHPSSVPQLPSLALTIPPSTWLLWFLRNQTSKAGGMCSHLSPSPASGEQGFWSPGPSPLTSAHASQRTFCVWALVYCLSPLECQLPEDRHPVCLLCMHPCT